MKLLLGITSIALWLGGIICLFFGGWFTLGGLVLIAVGHVLGSGS